MSTNPCGTLVVPVHIVEPVGRIKFPVSPIVWGKVLHAHCTQRITDVVVNADVVSVPVAIKLTPNQVRESKETENQMWKQWDIF